MSEQQKMDQERARVVDAMCMRWRHDFGLDKREHEFGCCGMTEDERDALRRQMGQLYDHHIAHLVNSASLPVGVPDGLFLGDALLMWNRRHDIPPIKVGYEYGVADALLQMITAPAAPTVKESLSVAPTVKAEQVQCKSCGDFGSDCDECGAPAPSLPAAGSAGEEVEVVGYRFFHVDHGYIFRRTHIYEGNPSLEAHSLMTVAQHNRIAAQLAARDAGVVRVPADDYAEIVRFIRLVDRCVRKDGEYAPLSMQTLDELRALLAQRERSTQS